MTVTIARALSLSVSVTPEEKVSFSVIFVMASHLLFMTTARFADWASLDRVMLMEGFTTAIHFFTCHWWLHQERTLKQITISGYTVHYSFTSG